MTLSREALQRLDQYLDEMRASMTGSTPTDISEIEQDIRDHIGADLADRSSPASVADLDQVLRRLGSPRQWAADNAPAGTPRTSSSHSFEDWLAYASAGSMVLFLAIPPLLVVSWLLARWTLARIEERGGGEALGTRRWLLYPPILIVVAPLAVVGLLWAFAPFAELGTNYNQSQPLSSPGSNVFGAVTAGLAGLGAYWILLGAGLALGDRLVRFVFYPFGKGFRRRHGWLLSGVGVALTTVAIATWIFLGRR